MNDLISPKYLINLAIKVEKAIFDEFVDFDKVEAYLKRWHIDQEFDSWENFRMYKNAAKIFEPLKTLNNMDGELLLKIAIDLGVATPDFIPSIPVFRNELKSGYKTSYDTFSKAFKMVETDPSTAIGMANSALESIIKEILKTEIFKDKIAGDETLYKLTQIILKEFGLSDKDFPKEMKTISSSLFAINQSIEKLRSEKTHFHGKTDGDYLIDDSIYTYFVLNAVSTVGLFLMTYFEKRFRFRMKPKSLKDDLPF